jgi:xanthine dehydrogenase accessory factor
VTSLPGELEARAEQLRAHREPYVAATVVQAERPTSAKPGDAALVLADGTVVGFVGGECAESSVQAQALAALATAEPVLLRITPSPTSDPDRPGTVTVHNPCLSGGTLEIFLEPALPPPLVVVHGDAPIARALAALATSAGYAVQAHSAGADAASDVPGDATAVVVASHGRDEAAVLAAAVRAGVPYVGLVASPRRGAAVLDALDLSATERAAIHTPAGLDIGARTPGEVAVSILAEIVGLRPRRASPVLAPTPSGAPVATDPVCGMAVATVPSSWHVDLDGRRWWFCGTGCRDAFVADPAAFTRS